MRIGVVARHILVYTELLVVILAVILERGGYFGAFFLIKVEPREQKADRIDSIEDSNLRGNPNIGQTELIERIFARNAGRDIAHLDIVRECVLPVPISALAEHVGVVFESLAAALVEIDEPNDRPDGLHEENRRVIAHADVPIGINRVLWVDRKSGDALREVDAVHIDSVVRALEVRHERFFQGRRILREHLVAIQLLLLDVPALLAVAQFHSMPLLEKFEVILHVFRDDELHRVDGVALINPPWEEENLEVEFGQLATLFARLFRFHREIIEIPLVPGRRRFDRDEVTGVHRVDGSGDDFFRFVGELLADVSELGDVKILHRAGTRRHRDENRRAAVLP